MEYALNATSVNGQPTVYGIGACDMAMGMQGSGGGQLLGTGSMAMALGCPDASGVFAASGSGSSAFSLAGSGAMVAAVSGIATPSPMRMTVLHGIPQPHIIPAQFHAAHPTNRIVVYPERSIVVPPEST